MEAVNNYFSGSVKTVPWSPGTYGYGQNTDLSSTGGVPFSSLLQGSNSVKGNDKSAKQPVSSQDGPGRNMKADYSKDKSKTPYSDQNKVSPSTPGDEAGLDDTDEVKTGNADEMAALLLMSNLQADRITASNGVELVTEKISTQAEPPKVTASSGTTTVSATDLVPAAGSSDSTKESADAAATALMEARNGPEKPQEKVVENTPANKYDPEEVLKSLEGQGKIVAQSSNSPSGAPSMDTHGPTGRAPGDDGNKSQTGTETEKTEESEKTTTTTTTDPMAGFTEVQASTPTPFANQTNPLAQGSKSTEATSETMMMRTEETTLASDLTNLLSSRFPTQNGQLTIELDPEHLGKITINVSYDTGHAQVSISATNQKTVEILTQSAPAMANIIQQKTGQETQVYIPNAQESSAKQDMASSRESNENAEQQQARQQAQQEQQSAENSIAFLQQMRLGLV
ncbi:hypothetical protein BXO88_08970 [Oribacterium sp. C9]|uniref:flagellar hook-length control protein FliK n=1 Tax=Oribacterium sp. C9 TaxID=1943579 RepID=UPI00098FD239|nr:flagellar hook-length control protein FliK [Oribacterium sp. C9]OON86168.1 hypothetical protein BXO88_08970 [Oribacterium sp. C9]